LDHVDARGIGVLPDPSEGCFAVLFEAVFGASASPTYSSPL